MWQFFVEYVSNCNILKNVFPFFVRVFLAVNQKFSKLEKAENMKKQSVLKERTLSSFQQASLPKWEGGKNAGHGRPFCLLIESVEASFY